MTIALAVFLTIGLGIGLSYRVSTEHDPDEGMPDAVTLAMMAVVVLGLWIVVAQG